jgi:protein-tyrosine phosphatase
MLSIFKRRTKDRPDLSGILTDMHSHLIPGIDDGSPDVATSLELIEGLRDLGYQKFIATPHILWDIFKNSKGTITPAFNELLAGLKEQNIELPFRFAAEYFLDYHVDELLEAQTPLLTIKDNLVLVEFSFVSAPLDLKEKLFALQMAGYQPVLAHPERYTYFARNREVYDELREAGYYFQVNLLSLAGYYGKAPLELATHLVKNKYVDLLGTDLHHSRHLNALQSSPQLTDTIKFLQDSGLLLNPTL